MANFTNISISGIYSESFTVSFSSSGLNYFQGYIAKYNTYTSKAALDYDRESGSQPVFADWGLFNSAWNPPNVATGNFYVDWDFSHYAAAYGVLFDPPTATTWYYYLVKSNGIVSPAVASSRPTYGVAVNEPADSIFVSKLNEPHM